MDGIEERWTKSKTLSSGMKRRHKALESLIDHFIIVWLKSKPWTLWPPNDFSVSCNQTEARIVSLLLPSDQTHQKRPKKRQSVRMRLNVRQFSNVGDDGSRWWWVGHRFATNAFQTQSCDRLLIQFMTITSILRSLCEESDVQ